MRAALSRDLAWAAFEPNGEALWARVRAAATSVLMAYWRNGELVGSGPEDAFYVRCGPDTMTQHDIDSGRLITQVGIAVAAPAEFVVVQIDELLRTRSRAWTLRRWFPN